jgi:hypothetical protein
MIKPKKKLATLVLDPKRWLRGRLAWATDCYGEKEKDSYLLRPSDRLMCCLGFECRRRGLSEKQIEGAGLPSSVLPERSRAIFLEPARGGLDVESSIASINDNLSIPLTRKGDLARVRKLRPLFEKLGVRLVLGRAR